MKRAWARLLSSVFLISGSRDQSGSERVMYGGHSGGALPRCQQPHRLQEVPSPSKETSQNPMTKPPSRNQAMEECSDIRYVVKMA
jgi:hypothetical protein